MSARLGIDRPRVPCPARSNRVARIVQAPENLTQLEGYISGREPHPTLPDFDVITVKVTQAGPVDGKSDLVRPAGEDDLRVAIRRELLAGAPPGARVRLRAARTSSGEIMAEPHPDPEEFSIHVPSV